MVGSAFITAILAATTTHLVARHRETRAEQRHPPLGDIVDIDGHGMHAVVQGEGQDVVLIHGSSGSVRDFTFALMPELAKRYRVTAVDRPGLGFSSAHSEGTLIAVQAELIRRTAEKLGARNPIVLGQSYGAAVALAWAVERPESLAALVSVSGPSHPWDTGLSRYYRITSHPLGQALLIPLITAFVTPARVRAELESVFAPQSAPDDYGDHFGTGLTLRRASLRANAAQRRDLHSQIEKLYPNYNTLSLPIEIVHGQEDTTVSAELHATRLANDAPNAHLTLLPGVGHMPHHVAVAEVVAAVDRAAARAGLHPAGNWPY